MRDRSTLAGAIGNTVEWFDFAVYGSFPRENGGLLGPIGDLVGRRGAAGLALAGAPGLIGQGATRTSEPESAVGWPPGAAVIVYTKRLPSGLMKLVAFWPSG